MKFHQIYRIALFQYSKLFHQYQQNYLIQFVRWHLYKKQEPIYQIYLFQYSKRYHQYQQN